jgi:uncharacterized damage-inducible protein DinB
MSTDANRRCTSLSINVNVRTDLMRSNFVLMASYNEWMNAKLIAAAATLSTEELAVNRGAFFGSIFGTFSHLIVGDRIWLRRFSTHPARHPALDPIRDLPQPSSLDEILFSDFNELAAHRAMLDSVIRRWSESLTDADLERVLSYRTSKGAVMTKPFESLIMHFFNHQTHHRGQITTLLHQAGLDVGVTDLLALIPNMESSTSN